MRCPSRVVQSRFYYSPSTTTTADCSGSAPRRGRRVVSRRSRRLVPGRLQRPEHGVPRLLAPGRGPSRPRSDALSVLGGGFWGSLGGDVRTRDPIADHLGDRGNIAGRGSPGVQPVIARAPRSGRRCDWSASNPSWCVIRSWRPPLAESRALHGIRSFLA